MLVDMNEDFYECILCAMKIKRRTKSLCHARNTVDGVNDGVHSCWEIEIFPLVEPRVAVVRNSCKVFIKEII